MNRRRFLVRSMQAGLSAGALSTLGQLDWIKTASAQAVQQDDDYKALVCVFFLGGMDSFNLLVPSDTASYSQYQNVRRSLAINRNLLLDLEGSNHQGMTFGLHPGTEQLQTLFNQGELSFVQNMGALIQPTTRQEAFNGQVAVPKHLFSHSNQQVHWMRGEVYRQGSTGWAGRMADMVQDTYNQSDVSMNLAMNFFNSMQAGEQTSAYIISSDGVPVLVDTWGEEHNRSLRNSFERLIQSATMSEHLLEKEYAQRHDKALTVSENLGSLLEELPATNTVYPESDLGRTLQMVQNMIRLQQPLGQKRQVFFVPAVGWDTHDNQASDLPDLLFDVSDSLGAFASGLKESGVFSQVTTFTGSEFGRTLTSNGNGTDHGWGGHSFVLGGSVSGGQFLGQYPELQIDGPDDYDFGRLIPSTSVDSYHATLCKWFGLSESQIHELLPNLSNFDQSDLGFMI